MHAIEKLLAEKAGKHQVATGEIVNCDVICHYEVLWINGTFMDMRYTYEELWKSWVYKNKKLAKSLFSDLANSFFRTQSKGI